MKKFCGSKFRKKCTSSHGQSIMDFIKLYFKFKRNYKTLFTLNLTGRIGHHLYLSGLYPSYHGRDHLFLGL